MDREAEPRRRRPEPHVAARRWPALALVAVTLAAWPPAVLAGDAPAWLRAAASRPVRVPLEGASHLVLLDQQDVTVDKSGRVTRERRYAIRVLTREGRAAAIAHVPYVTDMGRVKSLEAWLVSSSGRLVHYDSGDAADVSLSTYELYSDVRSRVIVASAEADTGAVFGFESAVEEAPPFTQAEWITQASEPVLVSRMTVRVPPQWAVESVTFDHAPLAPAIAGGSYTWELDDLPRIDVDEPEAPPLTSLAARVALTFRPPGGPLRGGPATFGSWAEVAAWLADLQGPAARISPALGQRAQRLVAGASSERDSVAAIARFVQQVRYAAIELGLGRGGGYRPHDAADVFEKSYGDCKDKANLMCAMLAAVGIRSHLVGLYASDPGYVHESWPSPQQFDHCILAVAVRGTQPGWPVVTTARGERLLFFDPTDLSTPFGELPEAEQQSLALVESPGAAGLTRLPQAPLESCVTRRLTDVTISADGSVSGHIVECRRGAAAAAERRALAHFGHGGYGRDWTARWITAGVPGASLGPWSFSDDSAAGCFARDIAFDAPRYAEVMQGNMLVFKPLVVSRDNVPSFRDERRQQPIALTARAWSESVMVHVPAGFSVDELPDSVTLDAGFGSYRFGCTAAGDRIVVTRTLHLPAARLPVERYAEVRAFFGRIMEAQRAPVVLVRK